MNKRSFAVVMLALMVAPVYGENTVRETLRKAAESVAEVVAEAGTKTKNWLANHEESEAAEVTGSETAVESEIPNTPPAENPSKNDDEGDNGAEGQGTPNSQDGQQDGKSNDEGTNPAGNGAPTSPAGENKNVEGNANQGTTEQPAQPGFIRRTYNRVGAGLTETKAATIAKISAIAAGLYSAGAYVGNGALCAGKFGVAMVNPVTYINCVKETVKGDDKISRFVIFTQHKAAITGIVSAALATAGYVYRNEIVDYSKKAYNWTKDQVQSLKAYIQG
jgi:hypothetical protein